MPALGFARAPWGAVIERARITGIRLPPSHRARRDRAHDGRESASASPATGDGHSAARPATDDRRASAAGTHIGAGGSSRLDAGASQRRPARPPPNGGLGSVARRTDGAEPHGASPDAELDSDPRTIRTVIRSCDHAGRDSAAGACIHARCRRERRRCAAGIRARVAGERESRCTRIAARPWRRIPWGLGVVSSPRSSTVDMASRVADGGMAPSGAARPARGHATGARCGCRAYAGRCGQAGARAAGHPRRRPRGLRERAPGCASHASAQGARARRAVSRRPFAVRKGEQYVERMQVLRGFLANITVLPPLIVTFQFNPETVSDNKSVKYEDTQGDLCTAPGKTYTGGGDRTISFDLKLHGMEQGTNKVNPSGIDNGIQTELAKLRSFLYPMDDAWGALASLFGDASQGKRLAAPPTCVFGFGTKILDCIVTDLNITETQFNSFLAPVRADVKVTLAVIEDGALYEFDKQHRNMLAALGLLNVSPF